MSEQWKPIDSAPPGRCLMWVADGGDGIIRHGIAAFGTVYRYDDGEMDTKPDGYHGRCNVTHWMPIPPAPLQTQDQSDKGGMIEP